MSSRTSITELVAAAKARIEELSVGELQRRAERPDHDLLVERFQRFLTGVA